MRLPLPKGVFFASLAGEVTLVWSGCDGGGAYNQSRRLLSVSPLSESQESARAAASGCQSSSETPLSPFIHQSSMQAWGYRIHNLLVTVSTRHVVSL